MVWQSGKCRVILVTTKKGTEGKVIPFSYDGSVISENTAMPEMPKLAPDYIYWYNKASELGW
ncbi:hypothetical protein NXX19_27920 [Bacteroides ovatus]|nr:hypothetical protein [Bacteroides ovatus]